MQVYELADELRVRSVDVLDAARVAGVPARDAGSLLDAEQAERIRTAHLQAIAAAEAEAARAALPVFEPPVPLDGGADASGGGIDLGGGPPPPAVPVHQPLPPPGMHRGAKPPMHPLISKAIWQFVAAQFVPCIGLYWFFAAYSNAGKGRRQVAMFRGKWGGDSAGLVIQILFWVQLGFAGLAIVAFFVGLRAGGPTTP